MSIVDAIKAKLEEVKNWLKGLIDKVKEGVTKVVDDIVKTVKGWVDKAVSFIYKIKDFFMGLIKKAWEFIKSIWEKVKELWEEIKKLPLLIYSWIQKGISTVIGLVEKVLMYFGDTAEPKRIAEKNCKALKNIIIVWDLCYWTFAAFELTVGKVMDLFAWVVNFVFEQVGSILQNDPFDVDIGFGSLQEANDVCIGYRYFIPLSGLFNIPTYVACHIVAHLMIALNDIIDIFLGWVTKLSKQAPAWSGRPLFGEHGLTFGSKEDSLDACQGFMTTLAILKVPPFPTGLVCIVQHRLLSGFRSLMDSFFMHAKAITTIPFPDSAESAEACGSWKQWPFAEFGGAVTHNLFVSCTVLVRVVAPIEWAFHWAWDQLSNLLAADTFDSVAAATMCEWKHWGLFMIWGLVGRTLCRMFMRVWNTTLAAVVTLVSYLLDFVGISVPDVPASPDDVCDLALTELAALHPMVAELPLFALGITCDVVIRLGRWVVYTGLHLMNTGLDIALMTLNGEGPLAEIVTEVIGALMSALVDAKVNPVDFLEGGMPALGDKPGDMAEAFANTTVFGLPKEVSALALSVAVPSVKVFFKYRNVLMELLSIIEPGGGGMHSPSGNKNAANDTVPDVDTVASTELFEFDDSSTSSTVAPTALLEVGSTQAAEAEWGALSSMGTFTNTGAKMNTYKSGNNLAALGNGWGIGGPVEVRQSYGHKIVIHGRVMHPSFNNMNNGHNADELAMCLQRKYRALCKAGTYLDLDTQNTCVACPQGKFSWSEGAVGPESCVTTDALQAATCDAGQVAKVGATSAADAECAPCEAGKFEDRANGETGVCVDKQPIACPLGEGYAFGASTTEDDTACQACTAGTHFSAAADETPCLERNVAITCDPGHGFVAGSDEADDTCVECSDGTFNDHMGTQNACASWTVTEDSCTGEDQTFVAGTAISNSRCVASDAADGALIETRARAAVHRKRAAAKASSRRARARQRMTVGAAKCKEGTFSATGEEPCVPCPAGTWATGEGKTECSDHCAFKDRGRDGADPVTMQSQFVAAGGMAEMMKPENIAYWLQEGASMALTCYQGQHGLKVVVDMVLDPGCASGDGGPFTLNDEEFAFEGLDECHDSQFETGSIVDGLIDKVADMRDSGASAGPGTVAQAANEGMANALSPVVRWMCRLRAASNADSTENDADDLMMDLRLCNMEALVDVANKKRRPFFGILEISQHNNAIKRIPFGEYGISWETQINLISHDSCVGRYFNKFQKYPNLGKALLSTLDMLLSFNLQWSFTKTKTGWWEFIADATSLRNIPWMFGDSDKTEHASDSFLGAGPTLEEYEATDRGLGQFYREPKVSTYLFGVIVRARATADENMGRHKYHLCFLGMCFDPNPSGSYLSNGTPDHQNTVLKGVALGSYVLYTLISTFRAVIAGPSPSVGGVEGLSNEENAMRNKCKNLGLHPSCTRGQQISKTCAMAQKAGAKTHKAKEKLAETKKDKATATAKESTARQTKEDAAAAKATAVNERNAMHNDKPALQQKTAEADQRVKDSKTNWETKSREADTLARDRDAIQDKQSQAYKDKDDAVKAKMNEVDAARNDVTAKKKDLDTAKDNEATNERNMNAKNEEIATKHREEKRAAAQEAEAKTEKDRLAAQEDADTQAVEKARLEETYGSRTDDVRGNTGAENLHEQKNKLDDGTEVNVVINP
jgi:hypothetical protein